MSHPDLGYGVIMSRPVDLLAQRQEDSRPLFWTAGSVRSDLPPSAAVGGVS